MKKRYYLMLATLALNVGMLRAGDGNPVNVVRVVSTHYDKTARVVWQDAPRTSWSDRNDLTLHFVGDLQGRLPDNTEYHILPIYISADGRDTLAMAELVCLSRGGYRYAKRRSELSGDYSLEDKTVLIKGRVGSAEIEYNDVLRLPGQTGGHVVIKQWCETCCDYYPKNDTQAAVLSRVLPEVEEATQVLLDSIRVLNEQVEAAAVAAREVKPIEIRECEAQAEMHIEFQQGLAELQPGLGENERELAKIGKLLTRIQGDDKTYSLQKIELIGYTSPEGSEESNIALSERRVQSVYNHIRERYSSLADVVADVRGGGEDWAGLRVLVETGRMKSKDDVIEIIDYVSNADKREKFIKELDGGKTYNWLVREYYPALRRIVLRVKYNVRASGDGKDMLAFRIE